VWNFDIKPIPVTDPKVECTLYVVSGSSPVGFAIIKLASLMLNKGNQDFYTITQDNKPAGKVYIKSDFIPDDGVGYEQML